MGKVKSNNGFGPIPCKNDYQYYFYKNHEVIVGYLLFFDEQSMGKFIK